MHQRLVWATMITAMILSSCGGGSKQGDVPPPNNEPPPALDAVDTRASQLASQAIAGKEVSLPALREALTAAGIAVRALDGTILAAPEQPNQGLALAEHDPEVLALLQAKSGTITLAELGDDLATTLAGASGSIVAEHLLEGLRAQAQSEVPTFRFWARYIVELGRKGAAPYDLLGQVTPADVHLDAVQHTLILLRFAGDVAAAAGKHGVQHPQNLSLRTTSERPNCTFTGVEGTIMDAAAAASGYGFGKLMEYLGSVLDEAGVKSVERYTRFTSITNLAISYLKLFFSFAIFDMYIELDAAPLVRTKSAFSNGEGVHTVKVTVSYDFSPAIQYINCLRIALNAAGLDASVPNVGVVEGAEIYWNFFAPEDPDTYAGAHLDIIAPLQGEEVRRDPTNAQGVADVRIEGVKQRRGLGRNPQQVLKQGAVSAVTTLKTADIAQDFVDAVATALGWPLAIIPELFTRMWPISATVRFPVIDWRPGCADALAAARVNLDSVEMEMCPALTLEYSHTQSWDTYSLTATGTVQYEFLGVKVYHTSNPDLPDGADFYYLATGSGTYAGMTGYTYDGGEDDDVLCVGSWSGSWIQVSGATPIEQKEDGTLIVEFGMGGPEEEDFDVTTSGECVEDAPLMFYRPWWDSGNFTAEFPPGVSRARETLNDSTVDDELHRVYEVDLSGYLPDR